MYGLGILHTHTHTHSRHQCSGKCRYKLCKATGADEDVENLQSSSVGGENVKTVWWLKCGRFARWNITPGIAERWMNLENVLSDKVCD